MTSLFDRLLVYASYVIAALTFLFMIYTFYDLFHYKAQTEKEGTFTFALGKVVMLSAFLNCISFAFLVQARILTYLSALPRNSSIESGG